MPTIWNRTESGSLGYFEVLSHFVFFLRVLRRFLYWERAPGEGSACSEPPGAGGSVPDCVQESSEMYCHEYHLLALGKDERRIDAGKVIPAPFVFNMLSALFGIRLLLVMTKGEGAGGEIGFSSLSLDAPRVSNMQYSLRCPRKLKAWGSFISMMLHFLG